MKLVIFIIGLFLAKDSYSQNKFSIGINYHFDRITWTGTEAGTYYDGYYNPVNSKISLEGTYNSELIGVGTGVSIFIEEYKLRQVSNTDLNSINYKSNNIAILLNTCLNFRKNKNTLFFAFNNEFIFTTQASKTIDRPFGTINSNQVYELEASTYNRWVASFGIGYKFNFAEKFYFKIIPYCSINGSKKAVLVAEQDFYKLGISLGVFRMF